MIWTTKEGQRLTLEEITDSHLLNILKMMKKNWHFYDYDTFEDIGMEVVERKLLTFSEVFSDNPWEKHGLGDKEHFESYQTWKMCGN